MSGPAYCPHCRDEFLRGVLAVLAFLNTDGQAGEVRYNEIVQYIGAEPLLRVARKDGAMRWSGLAVYARQRRVPGRARTP